MSARLWFCWGFIPLGALLLMGASRIHTHPAPGNLPLMVVFSAEQHGYLTPCGCSKPMLGGMPRRGEYLSQLAQKYSLIRVENGNLTKALDRQDELKAETLIEMFNAMNYDAINLGDKDFRLGLNYLLALEKRSKTPFLCANVQKQGALVFKPSVEVERDHEGKAQRFLIVGVVSEKSEAKLKSVNPDLTVQPVSEALQAMQETLSKPDTVKILLFQGRRADAEQIAKDHPQFHMIVYAQEGDHYSPARTVGQTVLVCNGQDGKYMGQAKLSANPEARLGQVEYVALGPDYADSSLIMQIKMAYLSRVEAENLLGQVQKRPTLNGDTFAGSAACEPCHQQDYRIWKASRHGDALKTLEDDKHDKDPECVVCHVVGLDRVSGFSNMQETPNLKDVGCESCHGPAAKHVKDPTIQLGKAGMDSCMQCHVPQHSPRFDYDTYWEMIKHGGSK